MTRALGTSIRPSDNACQTWGVPNQHRAEGELVLGGTTGPGHGGTDLPCARGLKVIHGHVRGVGVGLGVGDRHDVGVELCLVMGHLAVIGLHQDHSVISGQALPVDGGQQLGQIGTGRARSQLHRQGFGGSLPYEHMFDSISVPDENHPLDLIKSEDLSTAQKMDGTPAVSWIGQVVVDTEGIEAFLESLEG